MRQAPVYAANKDKIIARRKKRHVSEGKGMTAHLYKEGVDPGNNKVERTNRLFKPIREDGGGNRTRKDMMPTPYCLPSMATDWINGASFFDHLARSATGVSTPESRSASGEE